MNRLLRILRPPRLSAPLRYLVAIGAVVAATGVHEAVLRQPGIAPFLSFFPAVALAAWIGGPGPGLLAVVLSAGSGNYFFVGPGTAWSSGAAEIESTVFFAASSSVVAVLCSAFRGSFLELEQISAAQERAEQALREEMERKNHFLAMLSHELRNPLAPIRNSLYILEHAAPAADQAARAREVIDRQMVHLVRLVDDLLDVTRVRSGKIRLHPERLELGELVRQTVEDHRAPFAAKGITLAVEGHATPIALRADRTRLAQVLGNLLVNAAKFTPAGGRVTVTVGTEGTDRAVLRVRDTGAGIEAAMLLRLFEPFVQADATLHRSLGGLGLGLALVKGLCELHGGSVSVSSAGAGQGAEFTVRLPIDGTPEAPAPGPEPGGCAAPRRLLVIDDNEDVADTLCEALRLAGHDIASASDGPEGLRKAREQRPDFVFCDIGLPGMDGYEVARAFRADPALHAVCLVALTGYAQPDDQAKAKDAGFDLYLPKPPSIEKIEELLRDAAPRP